MTRRPAGCWRISSRIPSTTPPRCVTCSPSGRIPSRRWASEPTAGRRKREAAKGGKSAKGNQHGGTEFRNFEKRDRRGTVYLDARRGDFLSPPAHSVHPRHISDLRVSVPPC